MSAFMIATITVKDRGKFQDYLAKTRQVATPFGAELVHRGMIDKVLTEDTGGDAPDHQLTVIVKFPSTAAIDEWHRSDAYQALIPLRRQASEMTMISYETIG